MDGHYFKDPKFGLTNAEVAAKDDEERKEEMEIKKLRAGIEVLFEKVMELEKRLTALEAKK